jgi:Ribonuclease G/E
MTYLKILEPNTSQEGVCPACKGTGKNRSYLPKSLCQFRAIKKHGNKESAFNCDSIAKQKFNGAKYCGIHYNVIIKRLTT